MKILSVVGARPNFMKIAPFIRAISVYNEKADKRQAVEHILVHTDQHYDDNMSRVFFKDLSIPKPDINLSIGSGSHAEQVGNTMIAFEKVLRELKPDWVVVVGDVNATLACSVTAKKELVKCAHIEAGLRSRDMSMPEEINRLVTDNLCDLLFTPDRLSTQNLRTEGVPEEKIKFVGNIMIDTLELYREKAGMKDLKEIVGKSINTKINPLEIKDENFMVTTLHRPSNVDVPEVLSALVHFFTQTVSGDLPLIWPVHPRTRKQLELFGLWDTLFSCKNIIITEPLGYLDMLRLNMGAKAILTDSGGLQEECTILGTPCLTLRWNTERPVTLTTHGGASVLTGNDINRIKEEFQIALNKQRKPVRPELWDGKTAERCLEEIVSN